MLGGIVLILVGVTGCLLPVIPGFLFLGLGLEIIGIRLILQEKLRRKVNYPKFIDEILELKDNKIVKKVKKIFEKKEKMVKKKIKGWF